MKLVCPVFLFIGKIRAYLCHLPAGSVPPEYSPLLSKPKTDIVAKNYFPEYFLKYRDIIELLLIQQKNNFMTMKIDRVYSAITYIIHKKQTNQFYGFKIIFSLKSRKSLNRYHVSERVLVSVLLRANKQDVPREMVTRTENSENRLILKTLTHIKRREKQGKTLLRTVSPLQCYVEKSTHYS